MTSSGDRFDALLAEAGTLSAPDANQAGAYRQAADRLVEAVNESLAAEADVADLVGGLPLEVMYQNHRHHVDFMATVFLLGDFELLARTVPWVYRTYTMRGFSPDYFPRELRHWMASIHGLVPGPAAEILEAYEWLIEHHEDWVVLSRERDVATRPVSSEWLEARGRFVDLLLAGDTEAVWEMTNELVSSPDEIAPFYLNVVQPALYEIGRLWEAGEISIAAEHMASSSVSRVMAALTLPGGVINKDKGVFFVTASPNEFHEIGAWMLSDLLRLDGWSVRYFGSDTPQSALLEELRAARPGFLALSVTMPFNLARAQDLVEAIRAEAAIRNTRVLVGGQAFHWSEDAWKKVKADGMALDADDGIEVAAAWWNEAEDLDVLA